MIRSLFQSLILFLLAGSLFFACGSSGGDKNTENNLSSTGDEKAAPAPDQPKNDDIPEEIMENGANVYQTYCMACHQTNGSGNPGMYPPLIENETVNGDKDRLIDIIINGMSGEIEVKGEIYNQVMAPHDFLSNKKIADLLTYLRNSFGNSASMVQEEEVQQVREKTTQS